VAGEGRALVRSIPARCGVRRYNHLVLARSQIQEVFPLAACPRLAENSRLGFGPVASTSQWASGFSISSNTLGLSASLYDGRVRPRSTGKERDTESGNDYFGARYYANSMGRFMSPDYTGDDDGPPEAVPYADLSDPQSLNLYAYVQNNPLSRFDSEGHDCVQTSNATSQSVTVTVASGTCGSSGGTYVDGTVNMNSIAYNGQTGNLSFNISNYADGSGTSGTVELGQAPAYGPLEGPANQAGLNQLSNAAGVVNAAAKAEFNAFGFVFPLETLAADLLSGGAPSGTQAAGISKKPGTLGMGKGTDALRRENKVASDIAKKLGTDKNAVHELLQEGSQMEGRALTYREGLEYVAKALGKFL
jgi:RHS repeat-associated protein